MLRTAVAVVSVGAAAAAAAAHVYAGVVGCCSCRWCRLLVMMYGVDDRSDACLLRIAELVAKRPEVLRWTVDVVARYKTCHSHVRACMLAPAPW